MALAVFTIRLNTMRLRPSSLWKLVFIRSYNVDVMYCTMLFPYNAFQISKADKVYLLYRPFPTQIILGLFSFFTSGPEKNVIVRKGFWPFCGLLSVTTWQTFCPRNGLQYSQKLFVLCLCVCPNYWQIRTATGMLKQDLLMLAEGRSLNKFIKIKNPAYN